MRYRLRTLLLLLTAIGVWLGFTVEQARRQRQAIAAVLHAGGTVRYAHNEQQTAPPGPQWLRRLIGDEFFFVVDGVYFYKSRATRSHLVHLKTFRNLQFVSLSGIKITDEDLRQIVAQHPGLIYLDLADTGVSDEGLAHG